MFARLRPVSRKTGIHLTRSIQPRMYSSEAGKLGATLSWKVAAATAIGAATAGFFIGKGASSSSKPIHADSALGSEVKTLKAPAVIPYANYDKETSKPDYYTDTNKPMHIRMESFVLDLQDRLVTALESLSPGSKFIRDRWEREDGRGYGVSCVMQDGKVFEKAGVNVSVISGTLTSGQLESMRSRNPARAKLLDPSKEYDFRVAGVSVVIHPRNPYAPTAHKNYRRFEVYNKGDENGEPVMAWFGGGGDLTPSYLFEDDTKYFHKTLKEACDNHDKTYYPRFKKWCDEYFTNTHRGETRGVGGIFFDDLEDKSPEELFRFAYDSGNSFIKAYVPIVAKRMTMPYTQRERDWQLIRRGHYAEFNLIYDRGTKFGLMTPGARVESILMSLPLLARWEYMNKPAPGSPEDRLLQNVRKFHEWV